MPNPGDVSFGIDARTAPEGARVFGAAVESIVRDAQRAAREIASLKTTIDQMRGGPGGGITVSSPIVEQAQRAAGGLRAQADATTQLDRNMRDLTRTVREYERATEAETRARQAAIQRGLTALSTLGGEDRAYAQLVQWHIRRAQAMGEEINRGAILADVQNRLAQRHERAAQVFSTEAVNARDLRLNMASLSGEMASLLAVSNALPPSLLAIGSAVRRIAQAVGANAAVGGGSVNPSEGGGVAAIGGLRGLLGRLGASGGAIAAGGVAAGVIGGGVLGVAAIREAETAELAYKRIEAVLRATGNQAGVTASQVEDMADRIAAASLATDDEIKAAAAELATFRGLTADTFERTLKLSTDLAETGFGTVESAAKALGKAIESPSEGLTALTRIGVRFNDAQREQIEILIETGRRHEAVAMILDAVEGKVGGVAATISNTATGAWHRLTEEVNNNLEAIGNWIDASPRIQSAINAVTNALARVRNAAAPDAQSAFDQASSALQSEQDRVGSITRWTGIGADNISNELAQRQAERDAALERLRAEQEAAFNAASASREAELRRSTEDRQEAYEKLRDEIDKTGKAQRDFAETEKRLTALRDAGTIGQEEYNRLVGLAKQGLEGASEATRAHTAAVGGQSRAVREAAEDAFPAYLQALRDEVALSSLSTDARRDAEALLKAQTEARRQLTDAEKQAVIDATNANAELDKANAKATETVKQTAQEQSSVFEEPFRRAFESIQDVGADAFRSIFGGAEDDAKSFGERLIDIMREAAAQIAALLVFRPIFGGIAGSIFPGLGGGGGATGGGIVSQIGSALSLPGGSGGGGLGGFLGSIFGGGNGGGIGGIFGKIFGGFTPTPTGTASGGGPFGNVVSGASSTAALAGGGLGLGGAIGLGLAAVAIGNQIGQSVASKLGLEQPKGILGDVVGFTGFLGPILAGLLTSNHSARNVFRLGGFNIRPESTVNFEGQGDLAFRNSLAATQSSIFGEIGKLNNGQAILDLLSGVDFGTRTFRADESGQLNDAIADLYNNSFVTTFRSIGGFSGDVLGSRLQQGSIEGIVQSGVAIIQQVAAFEDKLEELAKGPATGATQAIEAVNEAFGALRKEAEYLGATSETLASIADAEAAALARLETERRKQLDDILEGVARMTQPANEAQQAIDSLSDQIEEAEKAAKELNATEAELAQIRQNGAAARALLTSSFNDEIEQQILGIRDPFAAMLAQLETQAQERLANATALGADVNRVIELNGLLQQRAIEQFYQAQYNGIAEFIRRQTGTTASPLPTGQALATAQSAFDAAYSRALGGDAASIASLPALAQDVSDLARAMFASGPAFFSIWENVIDRLGFLQASGTGPNLAGRTFGGGGAGVAGAGGTDTLGPVIMPALNSLVSGQSAQTATLRDEIRALREEVAALRAIVGGAADSMARLESAPTPEAS